MVNEITVGGDKLGPSQFKKLKIRRILVIFWGRTGEAILSTIFVQALRKRYGKAHISYVIGKGGYEILKNESNIDELIPANAKVYKKLTMGSPYDLAIDLYGGIVSKLMVHLSGAKYCIFLPKPYQGAFPLSTAGIKLIRYKNNNIMDHFLNIARLLGVNIKNLDSIRPIISITEKEELFAARFLKKSNISAESFLVGLQPGRHYEVWPELKYAKLAKKLIEEFKAKIIIFNGPGEKTAAERIHSFIPRQSILLPHLRVRDYFAVLSKCNLFVATSGGATHAGPAIGVPTIIVTSHPRASYWVPYCSKRSFYLPIISKVSHNSKEYNLPKRRILLTISAKRVFDFISMQKERGVKFCNF